MSDLHTPARPALYILIPQPLCADLRDNPIALGVYALLARSFFSSHSAIPCSAHDLMLFDSNLSYGQARRALDRLVADGWLLQQPLGRKNAYTPTWGSIKGTPRPWDMQAARLGCPPHVRCQKLPAQTLDMSATLNPHPRLPASVRPGTSPSSLLSIGQLLLEQLAAPVVQSTSAPVEPPDTLAPAPPEIDHVIDQLIGEDALQQQAASALECVKVPATALCQSMPWNRKHENMNQQASPCLQVDQEAALVNMPDFETGTLAAIHPALRAGHEQLNPERSIPPGEWQEILTLQQQQSPERLLVWQARAARRTSPCSWMTPDYYRACAAQEAIESLPPARPRVEQYDDSQAQYNQGWQRPCIAPRPAVIASLRALGIQVLDGLGDVDSTLLAAWVQASQHPDWSQIWDDPGGAARALLLRGEYPPSPEAITRRVQVRQQAQPPDWRQAVAESGGLARLGSDMTDLEPLLGLESSPACSREELAAGQTNIASDLAPTALIDCDQEEELRMALRLYATSRPAFQAVERMIVDVQTEGIMIGVGRREDMPILQQLLPIMTQVLGQRPQLIAQSP